MIGTAALLITMLLQAGGTPLRSLDKGAQSGVETARQVTVRDREAWASLWRAHAQDRPRPEVDFSREMVVGVFLGTRPTAGYAVDIIGTRVEGDTVVVQYRETAPARGGLTAQVLVSPYHMVAVPMRPGVVTFEKQ